MILSARTSGRSRRAVASVLVGAAVVASALVVSPAASASTGGYVISGHISLGSPTVSAGAGDVLVQLLDNTSPYNSVLTDANGDYSMSIPAGSEIYSWEVQFQFKGTGDYLSPWWTPNAWTTGQYASYVGESSALPLSSTGPTVADITLPHPASLSGQVVASTPGVEAGAGAELRRVSADTFNPGVDLNYHVDETYGTLQADGSYSFAGLYPGTYEVTFESHGLPGSEWATTHVGSTSADPAADDLVSVAAGQAVTGANAVSMPAASISGNIACAQCGSAGMYQWLVVYRMNSAGGYSEYHDGQPRSSVYSMPGPYSTLDLVPGTYRLEARTNTPPDLGWALSAPITVQAGQSVTAPLTVALPTTTRLSGGDRFGTSVAISQNTLDSTHEFSPGVGTVYIANALNFPDALAAGPAAASEHAPLLLVTPGGIPSSISAELQRLQPQRIVIVGGTASVSATVQTQLAAFVASPADVVRIAGGDRFATSRAIASFAFPSGAHTAYIATGTTFPDALSAGTAAVAKGGPLITINGGAGSLDQATIDELTQLGVTNVDIVGGTAAVSAGVEASLRSLSGVTVTRLAGVDRYDTSATVGRDAFDNSFTATNPQVSLKTSTFAFLALGTNFPDALAGVALAGNLGAPLFVTPGGCVPSAIFSELMDMQVQTVVLLGGPAALGEPVAALTAC